jgi:hypothetical protein
MSTPVFEPWSSDRAPNVQTTATATTSTHYSRHRARRRPPPCTPLKSARGRVELSLFASSTPTPPLCSLLLPLSTLQRAPPPTHLFHRWADPKDRCLLLFVWQPVVAWVTGQWRREPLSSAVIFLTELTVDRRPPLASAPTKSTVSSLFIPCRSLTCSLAPAASRPCRRWPPLRCCLPHHR